MIITTYADDGITSGPFIKLTDSSGVITTNAVFNGIDSSNVASFTTRGYVDGEFLGKNTNQNMYGNLTLVKDAPLLVLHASGTTQGEVRFYNDSTLGAQIYHNVGTDALVLQNTGGGKLSIANTEITAHSDIHFPNRSIWMDGGSSSYLISIQDGNGRVQHKWNATRGTQEKYLNSNEPALKWDLDPITPDTDLWRIYYGPSAGAVAGATIPWETVMSLGRSTFQYNGDDVYHTGNVDGELVKQPTAYEFVMPAALPTTGQSLEVDTVSGTTVTMKWV